MDNKKAFKYEQTDQKYSINIQRSDKIDQTSEKRDSTRMHHKHKATHT